MKNMMEINDLYVFLDAINKCKKTEGFKPICEQFCDFIGFEFYLFGVVISTSLSAPKIETFSNYPAEWYALYFEKNMQKNDPVVKYCFENTMPITWDRLITMEQYCSAKGNQVMASAKSMGLKNGLSVPVKAPSGEVSIFSIATSNEDNIQSRLLNVLPLAQSFSYSLLESFLRINLASSSIGELTPREKECLFWACEGKTAWEMSRIMALSERTAIFHLSSATKKLGASNRQHAVAKAIIHGLVKPVP